MRQRPTCTRMMREEYGDRKKLLRIQSIPPDHWSMVVVVVVMYWRAHGWLPLDELTADKSIRVNSEVSLAIRSVHTQPNTSELVRRHFKWNVPQQKSQLPEAKFRCVCISLVQCWRDLTVVVVWMEAQKIILTKMEALCINNSWKTNSSETPQLHIWSLQSFLNCIIWNSLWMCIYLCIYTVYVKKRNQSESVAETGKLECDVFFFYPHVFSVLNRRRCKVNNIGYVIVSTDSWRHEQSSCQDGGCFCFALFCSCLQ